MSAASSSFSAVKLSSGLVNQARDAASPMRRSVAGQIEYWATLGRIAEASGLLPSDAEFVSVDLHEAHAPQHITDPELRSAQARALAEKVQPAKPPTPLVA